MCYLELEEKACLPEPAQKSLPAHYQLTGRGISGWPAWLWVGKDLQKKNNKLLETDHASLYRRVVACAAPIMRLTLNPLAELVQVVHGACFTELHWSLIAL